MKIKQSQTTPMQCDQRTYDYMLRNYAKQVIDKLNWMIPKIRRADLKATFKAYVDVIIERMKQEALDKLGRDETCNWLQSIESEVDAEREKL